MKVFVRQRCRDNRNDQPVDDEAPPRVELAAASEEVHARRGEHAGGKQNRLGAGDVNDLTDVRMLCNKESPGIDVAEVVLYEGPDDLGSGTLWRDVSKNLETLCERGRIAYLKDGQGDHTQ